MKNNVQADLTKLAERISEAGQIISNDEINKCYYLKGSSGGITIESDSGYEAIYIGDLSARSKKGFMCLYTHNTPKRNSFPSKEELVIFLKKVMNEEMLETGEGKASYHDWEEFGGLNKQMKYFSKIVMKLAIIS